MTRNYDLIHSYISFKFFPFHLILVITLEAKHFLLVYQFFPRSPIELWKPTEYLLLTYMTKHIRDPIYSFSFFLDVSLHLPSSALGLPPHLSQGHPSLLYGLTFGSGAHVFLVLGARLWAAHSVITPHEKGCMKGTMNVWMVFIQPSLWVDDWMGREPFLHGPLASLLPLEKPCEIWIHFPWYVTFSIFLPQEHSGSYWCLTVSALHLSKGISSLVCRSCGGPSRWESQVIHGWFGHFICSVLMKILRTGKEKPIWKFKS